MRTGGMIRSLVAAIVLAAAVPAIAAAQGSTDIITGLVVDEQDLPIEGAQVDATSLETEITRSARTDADGRYTILFPDGGGAYRMFVRMIGTTPQIRNLVRQADEDRLVFNVQLASQPIRLEEIVVEGRRAVRNPELPTPGSIEQAFSPDQLSRLPIDVTDLNALAQLVPGIVGLEGSDTSAASFSVAGQGAEANAITLDGLLFGEDGVPQDALRSTRVVTSTFDVSRGQFSGGLVSSTTRGGTNMVQGSANYSLRDAALSVGGSDTSAFAQGYTQHRASFGLGGPILRDRLFLFGSAQLSHRRDAQPSLLDASSFDAERLGVSPDSVTRFLSVLGDVGVNPSSVAPVGARTGNNLSTLLRLDWLLHDAHTLTFRGDWSGSVRDPSRVGPLDLPQTGGESDRSRIGGMVSMSSRFGNSVINELRAYVSRDRDDGVAFTQLPEGRVDVVSDLEDGSRGVSTLSFGGASGYPERERETSFEVTNELSILPGEGAHRYRLGGLFNVETEREFDTSDQLGSFRFASLEDLAAGRASSFRRTLDARERSVTTREYGLYLSDVWRTSPALQLTYGLRLERSEFGGAPAYNPAVETAFGRRTDELPAEWRLIPRIGFTAFLDREENGPAGWIVRGGVGEFRGRLSSRAASRAQSSTGLDDAEVQLVCVGHGVPFVDWRAYTADPSSIPVSCEAAGPEPEEDGAPNVTLFAPDFAASRTWRFNLGVQKPLNRLVRLSADASWARGSAQDGYRDLNLDATPAFTLAGEGNRPVFVDPAAIVPESGEIDFTASRRFGEFGHVYELGSDLATDSKQLTLGIGGIVGAGIRFNTSYTLAAARAEELAGGFGGSTAGNPNEPVWARSDYERKHSVLATLTYPVADALEVTAIGRLQSGRPYTPEVSSDINGDGFRNDQAFVHAPGSGPRGVADAMARLLDAAPGRVSACLGEQFGQVAARNSCVGPWQGTFDLQLNWRPAFLGGQLMVSVVTINLLRGIDDLLHGDNARGWGLWAQPDNTLLLVNGFDDATQSFQYTVNERFGSTSGSNRAIRSPFQVGIQARLTIGPDRRREFLDNMRRRGGGGGRGGAVAAGDGEGGILARMSAFMPVVADSVLARADSYALDPEQRVRVRAIADSAQARRDSLGQAMQAIVDSAGENPEQVRLMMQLRVPLQALRAGEAEAREAVREVLTAEQWARLPEAWRNPPRGPGGGPGGAPGGGRRP